MSELTRADLEDFLYLEAGLLDDWRLDDWLALWTDDGRYLVPATDHPQGAPDQTLGLIADDLALLRIRVRQLVTGSSWAEIPRSRTRRQIANVRILDRAAGELRVTSNFVVHRFRRDAMEAFVGAYEHRLRVDGSAIAIREKKVLLAHETLHHHGALSILL